MSDQDPSADMLDMFADKGRLMADLEMLEIFRWYRMVFAERVVAASTSQDEEVLATLRIEATYQLAEFYYVLKAREIRTAEQIEALANLHNLYIDELTRDPAKMSRLGLKSERLLSAIFTSDTLPRLLQNWRERPGTFDQANLGRLLAVVMSAETCRRVVVACAEAGMLLREKTSYGTMVIASNGVLEDTLAGCVREARERASSIR
ncbi:MAG TPA: hypothetical protein VFZ16_16000 [Hyphomicrobiaceae bacterium]|nr:hypothetical protein [Hyphomicrobiaceae bacterium]